jgi:hypothetical protein
MMGWTAPRTASACQRFVPVRSIDNQAELMRHRARELLAGQRTAALNALRGHPPRSASSGRRAREPCLCLKRMAADGFNENGEIVVPDCVRGALRSLVGQIDALDEAIGAIDRELAPSVARRQKFSRCPLWRGAPLTIGDHNSPVTTLDGYNALGSNQDMIKPGLRRLVNLSNPKPQYIG